jgi:arsenate reductase (thioredoxin)
MKKVIFACVHSAGRSQMAAAFFDAMVDRNVATGVAAGTAPGSEVYPEVVAAMAEVGIDMSHARPRLLTDALAQDASLLITMGCGEACPVVPGLRREDWPLEDPKGKPADVVHRVRDEIRGRVVALIAREGLAHETSAIRRQPDVVKGGTK